MTGGTSLSFSLGETASNPALSRSYETDIGSVRSVRGAPEPDTARQVRTEPGQKTTHPDGRPRDRLELSREAQEIRELQARDEEVRAHEAAHAAAGGAYAGAPSYTYERGPDGRSYATGGEVGIDISPIPGDPQATLQKAQQVRTAALAPAQPSAQDMRVAQKAAAMAAKARQQLRGNFEGPEKGTSGLTQRSAASLSPPSDAQQGPAATSVAPAGAARLTVRA